MVELKFSMRPYLKDNRVCIYVEWNAKQHEAVFVTKYYAEVKMWDKDRHKAKAGCIHNVIKKGHRYTATSDDINACLTKFLAAIEKSFCDYSLKGTIPNVRELRKSVNYTLSSSKHGYGRKSKSLDELMKDFLDNGTREKGWDDQCREKYTQALGHLNKAVPGIKVTDIDKNTMFKLCDWYVARGYKNMTMKKQIIMLKAFLRYINGLDGYTIPNDCLFFEDNFKEVKRTVVFLTYDEIMQLFQYDFWFNPLMNEVRDLWCFMAFTSLRYSDLKQLCPHHIIDKQRIEMVTEKTDEHITVPLSKFAVRIIRRIGHPWRRKGSLFDVPDNTTFNKLIKDCAEIVGLTREITDNYYIGNDRIEKVNRLCDIISCHDARRSFVSVSLSMGIPAQMVMKCTGHTNFNSMRPYIGVADDTLMREMNKWNVHDDRSELYKIVEELGCCQLRKAKSALLKIKNAGEPDDMYVPESLFEQDDIATGGVSDTETLLNAVETGQLIHIMYKKQKGNTEEVANNRKEYDLQEGDIIKYYDVEEKQYKDAVIDKIY